MAAWGNEPPFRCSKFVPNHRPRPSLTMVASTRFTLLIASPAKALGRACEAAKGKDVRIGSRPCEDFLLLRKNTPPDRLQTIDVHQGLRWLQADINDA
jgi:hypothetical protein